MTHLVTKPIIVVGTHRSGTTFMGRALSRHPHLAYWEEPRHVWSWGHNYRLDDRLTGADARPRIARHIRQTFAHFLRASGRSRLAEKTPSNCLRLPFVFKVFPDARFVHVFRDGRGVVSSCQRMVTQRRPESRWFLPRLLGTPVWEWPAFVPRAWRTLGQRLTGRPMSIWGPLPPGWREWVRNDSKHVLLARQWRGTIEPVLEFRQSVPRTQWLDVCYEELVCSPVQAAEQIMDFAELSNSDEVSEYFRVRSDPGRSGAWRDELQADVLDDLRPVLQDTLLKLGYSWKSADSGAHGGRRDSKAALPLW